MRFTKFVLLLIVGSSTPALAQVDQIKEYGAKYGACYFKAKRSEDLEGKQGVWYWSVWEPMGPNSPEDINERFWDFVKSEYGLVPATNVGCITRHNYPDLHSIDDAIAELDRQRPGSNMRESVKTSFKRTGLTAESAPERQTTSSPSGRNTANDSPTSENSNKENSASRKSEKPETQDSIDRAMSATKRADQEFIARSEGKATALEQGVSTLIGAYLEGRQRQIQKEEEKEAEARAASRERLSEILAAQKANEQFIERLPDCKAFVASIALDQVVTGNYIAPKCKVANSRAGALFRLSLTHMVTVSVELLSGSENAVVDIFNERGDNFGGRMDYEVTRRRRYLAMSDKDKKKHPLELRTIDLVPGDYTLAIGEYDPATSGYNFRINNESKRHMTSVGSGDFPSIAFNWFEEEYGGGDRVHLEMSTDRLKLMHSKTGDTIIFRPIENGKWIRVDNSMDTITMRSGTFIAGFIVKHGTDYMGFVKESTIPWEQASFTKRLTLKSGQYGKSKVESERDAITITQSGKPFVFKYVGANIYASEKGIRIRVLTDQSFVVLGDWDWHHESFRRNE